MAARRTWRHRWCRNSRYTTRGSALSPEPMPASQQTERLPAMRSGVAQNDTPRVGAGESQTQRGAPRRGIKTIAAPGELSLRAPHGVPVRRLVVQCPPREGYLGLRSETKGPAYLSWNFP